MVSILTVFWVGPKLISHKIAMKEAAILNSSSQALAPPETNLQPLHKQVRKRPSTIRPREELKAQKKAKLSDSAGSTPLKNLEMVDDAAIAWSIRSLECIEASAQNAIGEAKNANNHCSEIQQLHNQSNLSVRDQTFVTKDLYTKPLPADEVLIAFREKYADEIRALKFQRNYQIFKEAHQQIEMMLLGMAEARIIALEILSRLERTEMVLLSCATTLIGQDFSALADRLKSRDWTKEEKDDFSCKFTISIPGVWYSRDILDRWEVLAEVGYRGKVTVRRANIHRSQVLIDEIHLRRSGETPKARANPSPGRQ